MGEKFNSVKYQAVRKVIESEPKECPSCIKFRIRCIARIVTECGMTEHGASTYYQNMAKHLGIVSDRSASAPKQDKVIRAKDFLDEIDEANIPVNARNIDVYSMVTVDSNRIAIDVRCFTDKAACLEKCNNFNKHFISGHQQRGARLGNLVGQVARRIADSFDYGSMLPS